MRTSLTSSVMSEATKRLEIGPELWFRVIARRLIEALRFYGAIAQLGERLHGMQEVGGSIPPGSTSLRLLRKLRLGKPAALHRSEASEGCRGVARLLSQHRIQPIAQRNDLVLHRHEFADRTR